MMSITTPFNALKLQAEFFSTEEIIPYTLTSIKEVSIEDNNDKQPWYKRLYEFIKNLLIKLKEKIIALLKFIGNKIKKWFTGSSYTTSVDKVKLLKDLKAMTDEKFNKLANEYIENYIPSVDIYYHLFDNNDRLLDPTTMGKGVADYVKQTIYDDYEEADLEYGHIKVVTKRLMGELFGIDLDNVNKKVPKKVKLNKKDFIDAVDKFDDIHQKLINQSEKASKDIQDWINDCYKDMEKLAKQEDDASREEWNKLNIKVKQLSIALTLLNIPLNYLRNMARMIGYIGGQAFSEKYTTTTDIPVNKLFHMSTNPNLHKVASLLPFRRKLKPRMTKIGWFQYLPPRISFAPTPIACCYGAPFNLPIRHQGITTVDLYLYEGIIENGKTRILEPEMVRAGVSPIEIALSQEICVVTDIKIKPLGKVRVTYDSDIEDYYKNGRVKKVEMLG